MTSKLTRERIELIANFHRAMTLPPSHAEIEELARMALAAMDSEPVGEFYEDGPLNWYQISDGDRVPAHRRIPLYRHAQPAVDSEPVAFTDEEELNFVNDMACMWTKGMGINEVPLYRHAQPAPVVPEKCPAEIRDLIDSHSDALFNDDDAQEIWNACRAAMLQAEPVKTANKLGNSPAQSPIDHGYRKGCECSGCKTTVRICAELAGWIPVSERMPESNGMYFGWDGKRVLEVYCFFGGFSANQFIHGEITHWMPLPAAPQEVK
ncbi:DUF551 domain-containing protein [Escherichia coli]